MRCLLVFDPGHDIIFYKCDKKFVAHIDKLVDREGLKDEKKKDDCELNLHHMYTLFSPIVASQKVMTSQFGNSYVSVQCYDGLNMVFDEYMGHLFVHVGYDDVQWLKRILGVCISIIQHLCGPDVLVLKRNKWRTYLVTRLLEVWESLAERDQAVLLETIEPLSVNGDLSMVAIKTLKDATDKFKADLSQPKSHALIFVENKFLAINSSRGARELSAKDMIFLSLLAEWCRSEIKDKSSESSDEYYSPDSSPEISRKETPLPPINDGKYNDILLLSGNNYPAASPYIVQVSVIAEGVTLVLLQQINQYYPLSLCLIDALEANNVIDSVCACATELEGVKRGMEQLDPAMKKVYEALKKLKTPDISPSTEACIKVLHTKWDHMKRQWNENNGSSKSLAVMHACCTSLCSCLRDMLQYTVYDYRIVLPTLSTAHGITTNVASSLSDFISFLKVKALKNFTLKSTTLSINKYLEEFPGLVHFIYIDRVNHRIIAPTLEDVDKEVMPIPKAKIWSMVDFSRLHLQEGHTAIMWKDGAHSFAYYLWFEDHSGSPMKAKVNLTQAVKGLPMPGVISGEFYQRLVESCFPKMVPSKVRCYELYCVHLGLATSSCILEQSRRLAATILELSEIQKGNRKN